MRLTKNQHGYIERLVKLGVPEVLAVMAAQLMLKALTVVADMLGRHPDFNRGNTVVHYCAHLAGSAILEATGD